MWKGEIVTDAGPFNELNTRRLGPVRRFFVQHPRAMDALVMIVAATSQVGSGPLESPRWPVGFALLTGATLWWRRSHPVIVVSLVVATGIVSLATTGTLGGIELATAFALYAVAVSRSSGVTWLVTAGALAAELAAVWLWEAPSPDLAVRGADGNYTITDDRLGTTAQVLIVVLAAIAIGNSVRSRREHLAELMERANAMARDRDHQAQLARAAERSRIAREMHDVVAHSLSVMITLADGASVSLERAPDRSRAALAELTSTGRNALGDMRRVLGALTEEDAPLEPTGDGQDLDALVERFRTAGLRLRTHGLEKGPPGDTGVRLALYRVIQEALTNALRHAPGSEAVEVTVSHGAGLWDVTVADRGGVVPVPPSEGAGLGLVGMRERVELLGGRFEAGPQERGWRVHVTLPEQGAVE